LEGTQMECVGWTRGDRVRASHQFIAVISVLLVGIITSDKQ